MLNHSLGTEASAVHSASLPQAGLGVGTFSLQSNSMSQSPRQHLPHLPAPFLLVLLPFPPTLSCAAGFFLYLVCPKFTAGQQAHGSPLCAEIPACLLISRALLQPLCPLNPGWRLWLMELPGRKPQGLSSVVPHHIPRHCRFVTVLYSSFS